MFLLSKIYPRLKVPKWIYKFSIGILSLSIILAIVIGTYNVYIDKDYELSKATTKISDLQKKLVDASSSGMATPDQLIGSHLEGLDIRIVDLAREDLIVKNRTIINCRIYGPAVLFPIGCSFRNNSFSGDASKSVEWNLNSMFIPIPQTPIIQGIIRVENVDFRDCIFNRVALMGPDQLKKKLLNNTKFRN